MEIGRLKDELAIILKERNDYEIQIKRLTAENDTFTSCIVESNTIIANLRAALEKVRTYLEERGIRHKGKVGRTEILPMIDEALKEGE